MTWLASHRGQGELLRRALGSKNASEAIERFHQAFIVGAASQGVTGADAEAVFDKLRAFGGYSFPKSHAAAFAVLVYQSAWLKHYHPVAFYIGLLNNQPMGFWSPAVLVNDARRHGIQILPVDVNLSDARCSVAGKHIRLGFNYIDKMGKTASQRLLTARAGEAFVGLKDFCQRTHLPRRIVENLIRVGAMDSWGQPRRALLWEFGKLRYPVEPLELVYPDDGVALPAMNTLETIQADYEILGAIHPTASDGCLP